MSEAERIDYDEFGFFHENAAEFGLGYDGPPTVRREHVEVEPGRELSALVWGKTAPELVLLHGGAQNAHTWDTVAMALRPRPLVAVDLPGHGHSDGPREPRRSRPSPWDAAEDVAAVIRELAPDAGGIVGMSLGGLTTIALTEVAPELVERMVLVDVLPGLDARHARHITDFVAGPATFPSFDEILARTVEFNPHRSVSSLRRGILHNALQLDDGTWVWRHARWRLDTEDDRPASEDPPAGPEAAGEPETAAGDSLYGELLDVLGRVEVPVLLARGMRSGSVLRDADEAELRRRLPSARVVHFEEAGHSIQGDTPVELAETIDEFVPRRR